MTNPRVLVITEDSILGHALSSLFKSSQEGLVVIASKVKTSSDLAMEINAHAPDVILMGISNPLAKKEVLMNILTSNQKIQLILVQEDSNWLHIFRRDDFLIAASEDLIKLIHSF